MQSASSYSRAATLYAALIFLLPIAALSFIVDGEVQKGIIAGAVLALALAYFGIIFVKEGRGPVMPRTLVVFAAFPLLVVACASLVFRPSFVNMVFGTGMEFGTLASLFIFAATVLIGTMVPERHMERLVYLFAGSVTIAALIGAVQVYVHPGGTTIGGQWPELAMFLAVGVASMAVTADARRVHGYGVYALVLAAMFLLLALFAHPAAALTLTVSAAAATAYLFVREGRERVPLFSLVATAGGAALLLIGLLPHALALAEDPRPSPLASEFLVASLYLESPRDALVGAGPNRIARAWDRYRFTEGRSGMQSFARPDRTFSGAFDLAVMFGIAGIMAFALYVFVPVRAALSSLRGEGRAHAVRDPLLALSFASIVALFFYPVGIPIFLAGALATGLAIRAYTEDTVQLAFGRWKTVLIGVALLALAAGMFLVAARQYFAAQLHARAVAAGIEQSAIYTAFLDRAVRLWPTSSYGIEASRAHWAVVQQFVANGVSEGGKLRAEVEDAVQFATRAVAFDPSNAVAWLHRASLYIVLIPAQYPEAAEIALQSLSPIPQLAPWDPHIYAWRVDRHYSNGILLDKHTFILLRAGCPLPVFGDAYIIPAPWT